MIRSERRGGIFWHRWTQVGSGLLNGHSEFKGVYEDMMTKFN